MHALRKLSSAPLVVLAACSAAPAPSPAPAVPIELHGADAEAIVARCQVVPAAASVAPGCWRATTAAGRAGLLRRLGCDDAVVDLDGKVLVAVVEPGPPRLARVSIGSEEGVDVLTLVLGAAPVTDPAARSVILLWVEQRAHQLAVVRRDPPADVEQTVGIFDGR